MDPWGVAFDDSCQACLVVHVQIDPSLSILPQGEALSETIQERLKYQKLELDGVKRNM